MKCIIGTPTNSQAFENTTRIKAYLTTGAVEIYANHQDLLGRIKNNLVEVDTVTDGRTEKYVYLVKEGVFMVSSEDEIRTVSYSYGNKTQEINAQTPVENIKKDLTVYKEVLDGQQKELDALGVKKDDKDDPVTKMIRSKIVETEDDIAYLEKILVLTSERK